MQGSVPTLEGERTLGDNSSAPGAYGAGDLQRGDSVGRYLVLNLLGRGGMGEVYSAHDPELDRKVALKILRSTASPDALRKEAQTLARLSHPSIVAVHDVGQTAGGLFIAMEHVEGQTLRKWTAARQRSWAELTAVMTRAGQGLAAAHAAGLVHLDFKPDNVMIAGDGRVVVLDFGLAQAVGSGGEDGLTGPMGTPAYMAPEQHLDGPLDARADQFSFCVTWFEAAFGRRPFHGASAPELTRSVLNDPIDVPGRPPGASRRAFAAVLRGLARDPAERWPRMGELLAAVRPDGPRSQRTALALTGAVAVGAGGMWALSSREPDCRDAADPVAGVWSASDAQRLRQRYRGAQVAMGDARSERIIAALDAYAERLANGYDEACRAAVELPARAVCLSTRVEQLRATRDVLSGSDEVLDDVSALIGSLQDVRSCRRADEEPLYVEGARHQRSAEVLRTLAEGRALALAGRLDDADAALTQVVTDAHELGWAGVEALARDEVAKQFARRGQHAQMQEESARALTLASRARSDEATVLVLETLISEHGLRGELEAVRALLPVLRAAAVRAGRSDVRGLSSLGNAHQMRGEYDQAEAAYLEAMQEAQDERRRLSLGANLGAIALIRGDYAAALKLYEDVVEDTEALSGPGALNTLESRANLADAHQQLGDPQRAREIYEDVLRVHAQMGGAESRSAHHVRLNLALALVAQGEFAAAEALGVEAATKLRAAHGDDHIFSFSAWDLLATLAYYRGDHQTSLDQSTALVERMAAVLGSDSELTAIPRIQVARSALALGRATQGVEAVAPAIAQLQRLNPEHPLLVTAFRVRAELLRHRGQLSEAEAAAREAHRRAAGTSVHPVERGLASVVLAEVRAQGGGSASELEALVQEAQAQFDRLPRHPDVPTVERLAAVRPSSDPG